MQKSFVRFSLIISNPLFTVGLQPSILPWQRILRRKAETETSVFQLAPC